MKLSSCAVQLSHSILHILAPVAPANVWVVNGDMLIGRDRCATPPDCERCLAAAMTQQLPALLAISRTIALLAIVTVSHVSRADLSLPIRRLDWIASGSPTKSATSPLQEIQGRVSPKSSPTPRRLSHNSTEVTAKASDFGAVTARFHIAPASHPVAAVIDKQPRTPFSRALPHACQRL